MSSCLIPAMKSTMVNCNVQLVTGMELGDTYTLHAPSMGHKTWVSQPGRKVISSWLRCSSLFWVLLSCFLGTETWVAVKDLFLHICIYKYLFIYLCVSFTAFHSCLDAYKPIIIRLHSLQTRAFESHTLSHPSSIANTCTPTPFYF